MDDMIHHMKEQTNVYAHQKIRKARAQAEGLSPPSILGPVSYTHLDVYKRQMRIYVTS